MGIKRSLLVVDMPKNSYNSALSAEKNAKIIKMTKCDAIKIESNKNNYKIIEFLVRKIFCNGSYWIHASVQKKFKIEGQTNKEIKNF